MIGLCIMILISTTKCLHLMTSTHQMKTEDCNPANAQTQPRQMSLLASCKLAVCLAVVYVGQILMWLLVGVPVCVQCASYVISLLSKNVICLG